MVDICTKDYYATCISSKTAILLFCRFTSNNAIRPAPGTARPHSTHHTTTYVWGIYYIGSCPIYHHHTPHDTRQQKTRELQVTRWLVVKANSFFPFFPLKDLSMKRYSSCRYNERQLIDVTAVVVRRVRPRAERWCDCEGHRRWCPLYVCSFFFLQHTTHL